MLILYNLVTCSFSAAMLQQSQQVPGIKDFFNLVPSLCGCGPESTMEHHSHYGPSSSPQSHHHSSYPPFHNNQFHQHQHQRHHAPLPVGEYMHPHMHNNNNTSNEVKDLSMPPQHSPPTMSNVETLPTAKKRDYPSKETSQQHNMQQQPTRKSRSRDSGVTCNKGSSNNGKENGNSSNSISSSNESTSPIPMTPDYNQHLV